MSTTRDLLSDALSTHTLGLGFDKNGQYVSYYDKWDINPKFGESKVELDKNAAEKAIAKNISSNNEDVSLGIGTPIEFYDRVYLDDYFGTKPDIPKDSYYGGYIRPAYIEENNSKEYP